MFTNSNRNKLMKSLDIERPLSNALSMHHRKQNSSGLQVLINSTFRETAPSGNILARFGGVDIESVSA
jgi:hypothetical protein